MYRRISLFNSQFLLLCALLAHGAFAQSLSIRKASESYWVEATAPAEIPSTLQVSHDLRLWVDAQDVASELVSVKVNSDNDGPRYYRLRPSVEPAPDIRIMALGDSMAADDWGWAAGLYDYFKPNVTVLNYATPSATIKGFLLSAGYQAMLLVKPDYVFIQFGWADAFEGNPSGSTPEEFKANLRTVIESVRAFNGVPFLVTLPGERLWSGQELWPHPPLYNDLFKEVATEQNVQLLDLYNISRDVVTKLGPAGSAFINLTPEDLHHVTLLGAKYFCRMLLRSLPDNMGPYLQGIYDRPPPLPQTSSHFYSFIAAKENYVYTVTASLLVRIFDVSEPTTPILTGETNLSGLGYEAAAGLATAGNFLYIVPRITNSTGLFIVDVSNPLQPTLAGHIENVGSSRPWKLKIIDGIAYVPGLGGLRMWDVSNPADIKQAGVFQLNGRAAFDVEVIDGLAYIAMGGVVGGGIASAGLEIVDVTDPAQPSHLGGIGGFDPRLITVQGNVAYLGSIDWPIRSYDISNPANPTLISAGAPEGGFSMTASASHLFVSRGDAGFTVLDIANPSAVNLVKTVDTIGYASEVAISGTKAYVADGFGGVLIYDIQNPADPIEIGKY